MNHIGYHYDVLYRYFCNNYSILSEEKIVNLNIKKRTLHTSEL